MAATFQNNHNSFETFKRIVFQVYCANKSSILMRAVLVHNAQSMVIENKNAD
jgi:hypothetical protein